METTLAYLSCASTNLSSVNDSSAQAPAPAPLPLTGERTVPGIAEENYWFRRHEVVYRALVERCRDRTVLEADREKATEPT